MVHPAGSADGIAKVEDALKEYLADTREMSRVTVDWFYKADDDITWESLTEVVAEVLHDAAYPSLDDFGGVAPFIDQYLESESSILLLSGTQGTGKSRLIRGIIMAHWMKMRDTKVAYTTDMSALDNSEVLFVRFRCGNYHFMVLEDVDAYLVERKHSQNDVAQKLLAASDGFLSNTSRKIILTTNLGVSGIDAALTRPGRCFAHVEMKSLDQDRATKLGAAIAGNDELKFQEARTVAQVYDAAKGSKTVVPKRNAGFVPAGRE
jgi:hypothetical protein